jgi:hypothetical protein
MKIRNIILSTIFAFCLAVSGFAAGSVTQTSKMNYGSTMGYINLAWTGDAADGTVPSTLLTDIENFYGFYLVEVETTPGSPAPTAAYDIVVNDSNSRDLMAGGLANRSATLSEVAHASAISPAIYNPITVVLSNNAVHSAKGTIRLYFSKSPVANTGTSTIVGTAEVEGSGTAGTQSGGVLTVQGDPSGTAIPIEGKGTAGSESGGVMSVQGVAAGTEVPIQGTITANQGTKGTAANGYYVQMCDTSGNCAILDATTGLRVSVYNITTDTAVDAPVTENPVYSGGIFETTPTVVETGDKAAFHFDANQNLLTTANVYVNGAINSVTNPVFTSSTAKSTGGATPYSFISTASANLTVVSAAASTLYSITAINPGATLQYVRLYNKATAPDPSACSANSDCPVIYFPVPADSGSLGAGVTIPLPASGWAFGTGLGYSISGAACTVVSTCTDETNSAAGVVLILSYK